MSLQPQAVYVVPEDTARVARAAFPRGNAYALPTILRMFHGSVAGARARSNPKDHGHAGLVHLDPLDQRADDRLPG